MAPDRGSRITGLFHEALGRDPVERAAFLEVACQGDQGLRDEVERLLAAHDSGDSFLEFPAIPPSEPRRFEAGSVLGAYTISSFIGAGGMGDVYRARDPRLGRDVAIKILPTEAAADADRRARFAREAQAVAALNHPNIVTVHSIEQAGDVHFLTMELVEGQTLREIIPRAGLSIDRLLDLAIPLADAIGTAHAQHIVHRDLKPANVMVTRNGRVKILDFGLAKLMTRAAPAGDTVTALPRVGTAAGYILGTADYMSPEQAEGRDVDHRTDVFSLGIVIFEMATGQRPFSGDSAASRISSILKDTPPLLTDIRPELPVALAHVIRRCLAKAPDRRYQSVLDLRNELEEIRQDPASSTLTLNRLPQVDDRIARRRAMSYALGVLVLAGLAGGGYLVWPRQAEQAPAAILRLPLALPAGVHVAPQSAPPLLAISPDGRSIAFHGVTTGIGRTDLYLQSANEIEARHVVAGEGASPFFSPDSQWLGYWADGAIWKRRVTGGNPERICDAKEQLRGASWGDDGTIVFAHKGDLWRVPDSAGTPTQLPNPGPEAQPRFFPHVLPRSHAALVTLLREQRVALVSLQSGEILRRFFPGSSPHYVQGGVLVFRRSQSLYAVSFDLERGDVRGEPQLVLQGVSYNPGGSETSAFDVSRTGALVFVPPPASDDAGELSWLNRQGLRQAIDAQKGNYHPPSLDPEGRRLAVNIETSTGADLWRFDFDGRNWTRLTRGSQTTGQVAWSSDGQWIVFTSKKSGPPVLFRIKVEGGDLEQMTGTSTPDGSGLAYVALSAYDFVTSVHDNVAMFQRQVGAGVHDLLTVPLDPPGMPSLYLHSGARLTNGRISPDGRWVVYAEEEAGVRRILMRPFTEPGRLRVHIASDAEFPQWSRDGGTVFFRRRNGIWAVPIVTDGTGVSVGTPSPAVGTGPADSGFQIGPFQPSADGARFLVVTRPGGDPRRLVFVPNWLDEVRAQLHQPR